MDEFSWFDFNLLIVITFVICAACVWFGKQMDEDLKRDEEELKVWFGKQMDEDLKRDEEELKKEDDERQKSDS